MEKLRCQNCGIDMDPDALKYVVEIRSFADLEGSIGDAAEELEDGINTFLDTMENMELTRAEDISTDLILILCKKCRDNFMSDPLQSGVHTPIGEDFKPILH